MVELCNMSCKDKPPCTHKFKLALEAIGLTRTKPRPKLGEARAAARTSVYRLAMGLLELQEALLVPVYWYWSIGCSGERVGLEIYQAIY